MRWLRRASAPGGCVVGTVEAKKIELTTTLKRSNCSWLFIWQAHVVYLIRTVDLKNEQSCLDCFKAFKWTGFILLGGLLL